MTEEVREVRRVRALFLSDVHLGMRPTRVQQLIDFLRHHEAEKIFLVGDIVDGWRLRRSWHWPQTHNDVVQKLLRQARKGTEITYIAGNHDEFARNFQGVHFGGIVVADRAIHEAADGKRFLVIHGDQFDAVVQNARWLAYLGDFAYDAAMAMNRLVARFRRTFGMPYWSFSSWAKIRVKKAVNFIGAFQDVLTEEARRSDVDGVICGHIHHPTICTNFDWASSTSTPATGWKAAQLSSSWKKAGSSSSSGRKWRPVNGVDSACAAPLAPDAGRGVVIPHQIHRTGRFGLASRPTAP
jgi:UDP-2,3-diacylglucosamine pyrophosphatase LpxH